MNKASVQFESDRFTGTDLALIERAYARAEAAHAGQTRKSGEPYLIHPVAVAQTVDGWGLDAEAVAAALLHDVVEDTKVTNEDIAAEFGPAITTLVQGLTKLTGIERIPQADEGSGRLDVTNENLRRLLLASTKDVRVLLIKLADRRHNLQTLSSLPLEKRRRIARESLEVYAPLADRLGMGSLKAEIEDLSFRFWMPEEYSNLERQVRASMAKSDRYLVKLRYELAQVLEGGGVQAKLVEGRHKHLYSIHKKLAKVDGDIEKLYDLIAVRVIVPNEAACYQALGLIHHRFKPLIYRIKDYIAVPKPNGYRSLHTTVFALDGRITEIQIRTHEMHAEAEMGLAAHFYYDSQKGSENYKAGGTTATMPQSLEWVRRLNELRADSDSGQEFVDNAKLELFNDRIFVYSPKGDLYDLPEGATPVDFAFAVHSLVGLRTLGARVNGKLVPLDTQLENRDVVDILTKREPSPNRDWLTFAKTTHARNRIRAWFRAASREANVYSGRTLLEPQLRPWGYRRIEELPKTLIASLLDSYSAREIDDIIAFIGEGSVSVSQVLRRLFPAESARPVGHPVVSRPLATGRVLVQKTELPYSLAPCCSPVYPQALTGYITRGKGVTVHRRNCRNLPSDADRLVVCTWELDSTETERLVCVLELSCINRVGLLRDLTSRVAKSGYNIANISSRDDDEGESLVRFTVEIPDLYELGTLMHDLEGVAGVQLVAHINP